MTGGRLKDPSGALVKGSAAFAVAGAAVAIAGVVIGLSLHGTMSDWKWGLATALLLLIGLGSIGCAVLIRRVARGIPPEGT